MGKYIAVDIGAESGRVIVGLLGEGKLELQEVHRFANGPVRVMGHLHWDVLHLFDEIKRGLARAAQEHGDDFVSVGIDTWAIDYGLLDANGQLLGNPFAYRDARTEGMMEQAFHHIPQRQIFEQSGGIQFLSVNTLYQLLAMVKAGSPQLTLAQDFLLMPDLLHFWLTGVRACEYTNATTTQCYDSLAGEWSAPILDALGIPKHIFPHVIHPGTVLGPLLPEVAEEVGVASLKVVAPATHDTASAVVAVPAADENFAWLSSGTWSLLGAIHDKAIITEEALAYNISSYGGAGGMVLPWKNIMGLWLVQECRRAWAKGGDEYSYDDLTRMAASAKPFLAILDPDHPSFLAPPDMPEAIRSYCRESGQRAPETHGEIIRTALESLALRYRWVIEKLDIVLKRKTETLHIVGGGSQNQLLNQFAADATQLPVITGPVEATAIGNVAVQAVASGELESLADAREMIRQTFAVETFKPGDNTAWEEAYRRFLAQLPGRT
ncbi:MAG: rhamnulokinase [Caldilineales bacterium]|nr:rhamnulokinase [Caldilineales bacterium]